MERLHADWPRSGASLTKSRQDKRIRTAVTRYNYTAASVVSSVRSARRFALSNATAHTTQMLDFTSNH